MNPIIKPLLMEPPKVSRPVLGPSHDLKAALSWTWFHTRRRLRTRPVRLWMAAVWLCVLGLSLIAKSTAEQQARILVLTVVPLASLFFGTGVIREEVEDQTLTYGFCRPVRRFWIYAARTLSAGLPVVLIALPPVLFAGRGLPLTGMLNLALAAILGSLAYGALFALMGQLIKWPAWAGLAYLLFWEAGVGLVPGFLGRLTLSAYVRAIAGLPPEVTTWAAFWDPVGRLDGSLRLLGLTALCLWLGGVLLGRRETVITR